MYIINKEAVKEINNNNYSIIDISGIIELKMHFNNIKASIDQDSIYLSEAHNEHIKINKHQITKIVKETNKLIIELDCFLKIFILKDKNIPS